MTIADLLRAGPLDLRFYPIQPPPPRRQRVSDENNLYGQGWLARRTTDGCTLEWDGGEIQTKPIKTAISEAECERLRNDPGSFAEIQFAHDPHR